MKDTIERFSNRVSNYVRYRPGYPPGVVQFCKDRLGLGSDSVLADIGSGTGLSAKIFLENGNLVYGIEPNAAMRRAAEEFLKEFTHFKSINGTSDNTTLPDTSVDLVIAAQAFHWFEPESTHREFKRILKPGGHVVLMWNERQLDTTEFLREYEQLLLRYGRDYSQVRHEQTDDNVLSGIFRTPFECVSFPNFQEFDFEGLKGRLLSSSYMPDESDPAYGPMIKELGTLFAKHNQNGRIKVFYDTNIFYSAL